MNLVQASDYVAGASLSAKVDVDVLARTDDTGKGTVVGRSRLDLADVEFCDGIPQGTFVGDLEYALDEYLAASFMPETSRLGKYGILHETGDVIRPSHTYSLIVMALNSADDPEFRFIPVVAMTREECRRECEAEGRE